MRKQWIYATQIALSLAIVYGLVIGCGGLSSTPTPPASTYPADISGHVTIAGQLKQYTAIPVPPSDESKVFWIVEVTVKNISYPESIEASYSEGGWTAWRMTANDEIYIPHVPSEPLSIPIGETYSFMTYFVVPQDLEVGDAQIRYAGQNPYSYGELFSGDRVVAYDWVSKSIIEETQVVDQYEQYFVKREITGYKKVGKLGDIDITEPEYEDIYMKLRTVERWEKKTSGDAKPSYNPSGGVWGYHWFKGLNISVAPWVINWSYGSREFTPLDPEGSEATFSANIVSKANFDFYFRHPGDQGLLFLLHEEGEYRGVSSDDVHCKVVQEPGDYVIVLTTKNPEDIVDWWLKIGVE